MRNENSFHCSLLSSPATHRPLDQRNALLHFKNSFMLDRDALDACDWHCPITSYPKTNSWNKSMDCCSWDSLRGILHSISSLFLLRHLRSLNLFGNNFIGSHISSNLSAFAKSTHLNLSCLYFWGSIPSEISYLSKVVSLDLSRNYTSVIYPFSSLILENSIFAMLVHNLTTLRKLVFYEVNMFMVSPKSFANLSSSVTYLSVGSYSIRGIFPCILFQLLNLTTLDISEDNNLSRILPKSSWTNPLDSLSLRDTSLSREIPNSIGTLKSLAFLVKQLLDIHLENNSFHGPLPIPSPYTSYFLASDNGFTSEIPSLICQSSSLQHLDLSDNNFSGNMSSCFGNITNLNIFPLEYISNTSLTVIDLSNNKFGGPIPIPSPITYYYSIASNKITKKIPSLICNATEFKIIDLSNNSLRSSLPRCLTNFSTNLLVLNLRMNYLEKIKLVRILTILITIALLHNSFQCNIPKVIGHLHSLIGLNLSREHLTSSIPLTLGNLTNLEWLDLSSNKLGGVMPKKFGDLASLGYLNLSKNQFTGRIPQDKQLSTFSSDSFSGNSGLCGTPQ
ncbi:hypothetical protein EUGRSUZ_F00674 [Eucalyptus grandis]|uniref:Uncharacterized protein n=2 Tax=Eucalyptus grandis TaxID=71139 RepID=A0ACC3KD60_EUCGR|nr:hypothetical protein EUGRSUZ_F00674 [Eucalyptus grandis]